jgi:hypothetical protein
VLEGIVSFFVLLDSDLVQQRLATIPQHIPNIYIFVIWVVLGMIFLGIGSKVLQDAHQVILSRNCLIVFDFASCSLYSF